MISIIKTTSLNKIQSYHNLTLLLVHLFDKMLTANDEHKAAVKLKNGAIANMPEFLMFVSLMKKGI